MAEQQQQFSVEEFRRWVIDTIYGDPKPHAFWTFFAALGLISIVLLGTITGHLPLAAGVNVTQQSNESSDASDHDAGAASAASPDEDADSGGANGGGHGGSSWLFPNPILGSPLLAVVLALPILVAYPWFLLRQLENRRYYRRMYGSFYHRP